MKLSNSDRFEYPFKGKLWKYRGKAGWYFITLPKKLSKSIRKAHKDSEEGWGRLKTTATIGASTWKTAIWFDKKEDSYLLPVKAEIRKKEVMDVDKGYNVLLEFESDKWFWDLVIKD